MQYAPTPVVDCVNRFNEELHLEQNNQVLGGFVEVFVFVKGEFLTPLLLQIFMFFGKFSHGKFLIIGKFKRPSGHTGCAKNSFAFCIVWPTFEK